MCAFFFGTESARAEAAASEVSCVCPENACGACEEETGVDFYTEKCGPALSKVKSCKRRQCRKVQDHEMCMAKLNRSTANRSVASTSGPEPRSADVILAVGHAQVVRTGKEHAQTKEDLAKGMKVYAGDRILTAEDGRVRIRFPELSEIFVSPQSDIVVAEALIEKRNGPAKRTILLDLVKGRVRSRVQGRYNDGESRFEVKTPAAVAGVRGTDFTVSFEGGAEWKTEVRTTTGEVSLDGLGAGANGRKHESVFGGYYAAYVVTAPPPGASPFEVEAALARGFMSPPFKMSEEDLKRLDIDMSEASITDTDFRNAPNTAKNGSGKDRGVASTETPLCRAPAATFNQCSWTCEGNPKGASTCRSDLASVRCVRRLCRASGEWAEPTVLPAKQGVNCEASKPVVGDCGGYW